MYWSQLVQTCFFGSYFFGFVQHDTVWVCLSPALAILSCSRDGTSSVIITELHHGLKHLSRQLRWASLVTAWVVCSNNLLKNRCRSDKNSTATDKYCISSSFGFEIQLYHPQTLNFAASEFLFTFHCCGNSEPWLTSPMEMKHLTIHCLDATGAVLRKLRMSAPKWETVNFILKDVEFRCRSHGVSWRGFFGGSSFCHVEYPVFIVSGQNKYRSNSDKHACVIIWYNII